MDVRKSTFRVFRDSWFRSYNHVAARAGPSDMYGPRNLRTVHRPVCATSVGNATVLNHGDAVASNALITYSMLPSHMVKSYDLKGSRIMLFCPRCATNPMNGALFCDQEA